MKRAYRGLRDALDRYELVPQAAERISRRDWLPRGRLHVFSVSLLCVVCAVYLAIWVHNNWLMLTDPALQDNDVRTLLFPFHRFGPEQALLEDPIANDMYLLNPPGIRALYALFVPLSDLHVATKLVQAVAFGLVVVAGLRLMLAKNAGLGAGLLLIFLVLHTSAAVKRFDGGLPRAFAFPVFALWIAGAVSKCERTRFAAIWLAAATYPSAMLMLLGAEGIMTLVPFPGQYRGSYRSRLARGVLVVLGCAVIVLPYMAGNRQLGHVHTLEEARSEPAFQSNGRLPYLPFPDPWPGFAANFMAPLGDMGRTPFLNPARQGVNPGVVIAIAVIAGLLLLVAMRLAPVPWAALAFAASCVALYIVARLLAFRLYAPERFYAYGAVGCAILFAVAILGRIGARSEPARWLPILRNSTAAVFIAVLWALTGNGPRDGGGVTIDERQNSGLYAFVRTLPVDVRIACHPHDADIPYWTGRATTDNIETLQPWLRERWQVYLKRTQDTLRALYATDVQEFFDYADRQGITHVHLNARRYGRGIRSGGIVGFEPLLSFSRRLLSGVRESDVIFKHLPADAVVYSDDGHYIVDVAKWRATLDRSVP